MNLQTIDPYVNHYNASYKKTISQTKPDGIKLMREGVWQKNQWTNAFGNVLENSHKIWKKWPQPESNFWPHWPQVHMSTTTLIEHFRLKILIEFEAERVPSAT